MASSSSSSTYLIKFHSGGVFGRDPFSYDYEILTELPNVDLVALNFLGLRTLKNDGDLAQCVELGNVEQKDDSDSDLEGDYNIFEYDSESEESDIASFDHLSDGKEEVFYAKTRKPDPAPKEKSKKMFDDNFLSRIYNGLPRDEYAEKDVSDKDNLGDHWPIHDPNIKWKLMRPVLGERYGSHDQLKRALSFYALANGYKLYYEVNNPRRLVPKC
ncbi:hypothetical protein Tco_0669247 [Tanacetum coccineum]